MHTLYLHASPRGYLSRYTRAGALGVHYFGVRLTAVLTYSLGERLFFETTPHLFYKYYTTQGTSPKFKFHTGAALLMQCVIFIPHVSFLRHHHTLGTGFGISGQCFNSAPRHLSSGEFSVVVVLCQAGFPTSTTKTV